MLARVRSRLTYANVTATIALFVALGGTAYAAATIGSDDVIDNSLRSEDIKNETLRGGDLATNTIGSTRIIDDTLTADDIKNGTIGSSDIAANSLGGGRIADNSLKAADIDEGSLTGVKISGYTQVRDDSLVDDQPTSESPQTAMAECPPGKNLISTGYGVYGDIHDGIPPNQTTAPITVHEVYAGINFVQVTADETQATSEDWYVTAYATCANGE
jgi:hypothetical protein